MGMQSIRNLAEEICTNVDDEYLERWFDASSFFGTAGWHGPYRGVYFICRDKFMSSTIYSAKKMTPDGIETLRDENDKGALRSFKEARELIRLD